MRRKKVKNPLLKRIPRELLGDWKKYLVVSLFLILTIGFVSGMYVANGSMMKSADEGVSKYKLEDGHFELESNADEDMLSAIQSGEKADVKQYYLDEAKAELDEKFGEEFEAQMKQSLLAQGLDEALVTSMLPTAITQAKEDGTYQKAYDEAWEAILEEIDEEYADAEEVYELNDSDFQSVPVTVYENF